MSTTRDHQRVLFHDGEEITEADLNDIGNAGTQDAWEWPGYMGLLPHALLDSFNFASCFSSAVQLDNMVFCKGGGPGFTSSGLDFYIEVGFLGAYYGSAAPPTALDPKMRWIFVDAQTPDTLAAAPSGQFRYDLLTLSIAEVDDTGATRDFKDQVTGAITTNTFDTRRRYKGTLSIITGTPGATPTPPLPGSRLAVALIKVDDTEIVGIYDLTYPVGPGHTHVMRPRVDAIHHATRWVGRGGLSCILAMVPGVAPATTDLYLLPGPFTGEQTARLIGFEMSYELTSPFTVKLVRLEPKAPDVPVTILTDLVENDSIDVTGVTVLSDISSEFSAGSHITLVDLRGYPINSGAAPDRGPFWGSGYSVKLGQWNGQPGTTIALHILPGDDPARINWVKWYFAKG